MVGNGKALHEKSGIIVDFSERFNYTIALALNCGENCEDSNEKVMDS